MAKAKAMLSDVPAAEIWPMDLVTPASIDAFAERFVASGSALNMLVLRAGIMALPARMLDARGIELQFATNHLGHFQLTGRLWPALLKARSARVVAVSSRGHRFSPVVFDNPNFVHRPYDRWLAYGQSKTANVLFACELDRLARPTVCAPSRRSRTWDRAPQARQVAGVKPYAVDPAAARRLWAMSEELTGVAYPGR